MIIVIVGVAGKGKTALATQLALGQAGRGRPIFSNYNISWKTFGLPLTSFDSPPSYFQQKSFPINSYIVLDEAQNDYNSRYFKDMTKEEIKYFSGHRHLGLDIVLTTQHPNRIDVVLRENADSFLWIRYALPFGWKICYEYPIADYVGKLPPEVPKDFVKFKLHKVTKSTYTKYDDKYLKDKILTNFMDTYPTHEYHRSKYRPLYVRIYRSLKTQIDYYKHLLELKKAYKIHLKEKE